MAASFSSGRRSARLLNLALVLVACLMIAAVGADLADQALRQRIGTVLRLRARSDELLRQLIDAETSVRGYVLTGDRASLEPYQATQQQYGALAGELDTVAASLGGEAPALVSGVTTAAAEWHDTVAQPAIERRAAGDTEAASAIVAAPASRERFDAVRARWQALDRYTGERETQESTLRVRFDLLSLGFLILLGGLTAATVLLGRRSAGRAEARAAELGALVNALQHGVIFYDSAGCVLMANAAIHALFSLPAGLLRGRTAAEAFELMASRFAEPEQRRAAVARLTRVAEPEQAELMLNRPVRRILRRSLAPVTLASGRRLGWLELFEDVTASRELDRARDQLVATAAHDLRNPLTTIRGYVQLLERGLDGAGAPDPARVERAVTTIELQVDHMLALVNDLLDVSRASLGRLDLRLEPVDLAAVAADVARRVEPIEPEAGPRRLRLSVPAAPIPVEAERLRLEQALTNLITNGLKYSPEEQPVEVRLRLVGDEAWVEIEDRGPGIMPEELPHVGKPFYRTSGALESGKPGTGLGVAIVRAVAEAHGGRLDIESTPGSGSTFRLVLPLDTDAPSELLAPADVAAPPDRLAGSR